MAGCPTILRDMEKLLLLVASVGPRLLACVSFFLILQSVSAAVWPSDGTPQSIQYLHDTSARDGDTITLPPGTFHWTTTVNISKGITLQGQTTVDTVNGTANDQTIIECGSGNGSAIFWTVPVDSPGSICRVTGLTFVTGTLNAGLNGTIIFQANFDGMKRYNVRYDHIHYSSSSNSNHLGIYGPIFGVADHVLINNLDVQRGQSQIQNHRGVYGDEEFVEATPWGTRDFWFFEDCYFGNVSGPINSATGGIDAMRGGKYVVRHCKIFNTEILMHGTGHADGRRRGGRAREEYTNEYTWPFAQQITMDGVGSGTLLTHDNTFFGTAPAGYNLSVFRAFANWNVWNGANGVEPFDATATEADGTHVDGHPAFAFATGTVSSSTVSGSVQTLTDTSKNWTINQWVNYVATEDTTWFGIILSNTTNTLTMFHYVYAGQFTAEHTYHIYKIAKALDQPGSSGGDLITGGDTSPVNSTTGTRSWVHQTVEGCYSWNNIHLASGRHINFTMHPESGQSLLQEGRDFFSDTVKPGYTPYVYPHPLVSGEPTPSPSPTATPTATATVPPTATPRATAAPTPAAPTALKPTNETASRFTANWRRVSGATGYRLDVSTSSTFASYVPGYQDRNVGNVTSQNVTGLAANTFYYYRVRTYNGNGTSRNSNVIRAKTKTR
jgi:hypothetical protein